jgi:hypothetical protein
LEYANVIQISELIYGVSNIITNENGQVETFKLPIISVYNRLMSEFEKGKIDDNIANNNNKTNNKKKNK